MGNVLAQFKEKKGATAPLTILSNFWDVGAFMGAYGVKNGFILDDSGKVVYGPMQDGYKEFLIKMNDWLRRVFWIMDLLRLTEICLILK